jgi:hypothetical protein
MSARPWYEDVPVPQLMREARDAYRDAIRLALAAAGCDDSPRNGAFVLVGSNHGVPEPAFSPRADVVASAKPSTSAVAMTRDSSVATRRRSSVRGIRL